MPAMSVGRRQCVQSVSATCMGLTMGSAWAQGAGFDAKAWLMRVQQAPGMRSYQGTMVVAGNGTLSSSRISHWVDGRQRFERIEALDGKARQQYRHNQTVLTLWPQTRVAVFETEDPVIDFPALPAGSQRLMETYEIRLIGQERMAGLEADVVMVKARDALRFSQRLWAERESGLLLRADVLGARGETLESSAFTELTFAAKASAEDVMGPMKRLDGYRVLRPPSQPARLESEGWVQVRPLAGFQLISCVRRALDASSPESEWRPVLQAVYSDGLAHVSIFIEPFNPQRHRAMRTSLGAVHTSTSRHDDWWITVMGDVPMTTIQQFESGVQRR